MLIFQQHYFKFNKIIIYVLPDSERKIHCSLLLLLLLFWLSIIIWRLIMLVAIKLYLWESWIVHKDAVKFIARLLILWIRPYLFSWLDGTANLSHIWRLATARFQAHPSARVASQTILQTPALLFILQQCWAKLTVSERDQFFEQGQYT